MKRRIRVASVGRRRSPRGSACSAAAAAAAEDRSGAEHGAGTGPGFAKGKGARGPAGGAAGCPVVVTTAARGDMEAFLDASPRSRPRPAWRWSARPPASWPRSSPRRATGSERPGAGPPGLRGTGARRDAAPARSRNGCRPTSPVRRSCIREQLIPEEDYQQVQFDLARAEIDWQQAALELERTRDRRPDLRHGHRADDQRREPGARERPGLPRGRLRLAGRPGPHPGEAPEEPARGAAGAGQRRRPWAGPRSRRGSSGSRRSWTASRARWRCILDMDRSRRPAARDVRQRAAGPRPARRRGRAARRRCLVYEDEEPHVFVVEQGQARKQPVGLGYQDESRAEVVSGLDAGQLVVLVGQSTLKDGSPVSAEDEDGPTGRRPGRGGRSAGAGRRRRPAGRRRGQAAVRFDRRRRGPLRRHRPAPGGHPDGHPGRGGLRRLQLPAAAGRADARHLLPLAHRAHRVHRSGARRRSRRTSPGRWRRRWAWWAAWCACPASPGPTCPT